MGYYQSQVNSFHDQIVPLFQPFPPVFKINQILEKQDVACHGTLYRFADPNLLDLTHFDLNMN